MIRVVLLGYGNVGLHLHRAMVAAPTISVLQIYNRTPITIEGVQQTQQLSELMDADVYIIAVPDHAVANITAEIQKPNALVVHTSGAVAMDALSDTTRKGVVYPLQTFSKARDVSFADIPICIEAKHATDLDVLRNLGEALSDTVVEVSSEKRKILHLAAVFVNNFVNHMYSVAAEISEENQIDFNLLKPLIRETAKKVDHLSPKAAQTGPAKRNDTNTIDAHLGLLKNENHKAIYTYITDAILKHHTHQKN